MSEPIDTGPVALWRIDEAAARLRDVVTLRSVPLFQHGSLLVKYYAPIGTDAQTPHTRDEAYVVARGSGVFFDGEARRAVNAGDLLFIVAGRPHRFESFTDDFGVWVLFYGPEGGERT